uniref:Capping protein regulator and myosin 1 linker 2 n=1 Tax=Coturnix japonica TaxID=93934 RepID=A0A8C2THI2_COTJA
MSHGVGHTRMDSQGATLPINTAVDQAGCSVPIEEGQESPAFLLLPSAHLRVHCLQCCLLFAGGFSETYAALCDYNGFAFREEIQWDVDNIYHGQDCREFNLLDFSHLESRDVALSVAALSFNLWFTKLSCKDFRLVSEITEQLLYMLSKSVMLEELVLENMQGHKAISIQRRVVSWGGGLGHRITALSRLFEERPRGLQSLNLARTMLTAKGMSSLCQALAANEAISSSLRHLDLSGNPGSLAMEDTSSLQSLLGRCSSLTHLSLAATDCSLDTLFGALVHGCCASLVHLDVSKNIYSHRVKTISPSVKEFFSQARALRHISMAGTKLPPDAVRAVLQGLAYNSHISDLHLDLSSCELRSAGAQVIQDLIPDAGAISDLDLSDNGFDSDMVTLVLSIGRSKSIRHVSLGKNFNIKSKDGLVDVLHRIVQLTQEDDCPLQSLSVAESRLKLGTNVLLSALGSNTSLTMLDISGNAMGDTGAKMLAKALQINTKLRTVVWDRNNTTALGLLEVAQALERNYTLKSMPLPMSDVAQAYRSNPERTEEAVHKVGQRLGWGPGSSVLQMVNEICLSVQKHVDILSSCPDREMEADILRAEEAIRNANLAISVSLCGDRGLTARKSSACGVYIHIKMGETSGSGSRRFHLLCGHRCKGPRASLPLHPLGTAQRRRRGSRIHPRLRCTADAQSLPAASSAAAARSPLPTRWASRPSPGLSELELPAAGKARPAPTKDAEPSAGAQPGSPPVQALMDLPTAGERLEHCTKARPRPNRRHKQPPSKPPVSTAERRVVLGQTQPCADLLYASSSSPTVLESSPGSAPLASSSSRTLKKKIGNFFAFKKPKSSRSSRCDKEPEGGSAAPRSRRSMLSDILRAPSKAGEPGKALSKSEEGALSIEPEHSQTPEAARRIRPKYSREGKSQSLILLPGEDEEALGVRQDKKRHLEKSDGELPNSFEQRVHIMLHRMGVTKGLVSESKKQQVRMELLMGKACTHTGDIVDSSADSPPSLKARTHSVSTGTWISGGKGQGVRMPNPKSHQSPCDGPIVGVTGLRTHALPHRCIPAGSIGAQPSLEGAGAAAERGAGRAGP